MRTIAKQPGKRFEVIEIENSLEALQKFVGGFIETVTIIPNLVIICNEEGRLNGMRYNRTIAGIDFFGPILICGVNGEEFCDVPKHAPSKTCKSCICGTCANDNFTLYAITDEWNPCCERKGHKLACIARKCPDYKKESPAEAEQQTKITN